MGLVLQYQLKKLVLTVAPAAVQAKTAVVNILPCVTFTTDWLGLVRISSGSMTGVTGKILV